MSGIGTETGPVEKRVQVNEIPDQNGIDRTDRKCDSAIFTGKLGTFPYVHLQPFVDVIHKGKTVIVEADEEQQMPDRTDVEITPADHPDQENDGEKKDFPHDISHADFQSALNVIYQLFEIEPVAVSCQDELYFLGNF
ncbi:hypothetical protein D3C86_1237590 [compost metagenome]